MTTNLIYKQPIRPVLKWAGGKRQLLESILPIIPIEFSTYYEPFIGAGAVLLELQPANAVINDINPELMNVYYSIRNSLEDLILELKNHQNCHNGQYYYMIRALDRDPKVFGGMSLAQRAARTIYLNRTCYNGLYRVNRKGHFNTPLGRYVNPKILNEDDIRRLSEYLNHSTVELRTGDYRDALKGITKNDFVYFDPPYQPLNSTSRFTGYAKEGFNWNEQIGLWDCCKTLTKAGIRFVLSNSDTPDIRHLYRDFHIKESTAYRFINSNVRNRSAIAELLISNYSS